MVVMASAAATPVRMRRTKAKVGDTCALCPVRIKAGQWIGLHYASNSWVHVGCLVRKLASA